MYIGTLRGWAIAYLHLTPLQFYSLRVGEFWEAMDAYWTEKGADRKHLGELVRGAAVRLFNTQVKTPVRNLEKFWAMPWDDPTEEDEQVKALDKMTDEQRAASARSLLQKIGW